MGFIVVEGIEGSGKSTLINKLAEELKTQGYEVVKTREPGATEVGQTIREILLNKENTQLAHHAELMLFFADRAQHLKEVIRPALERKAVVICDRFSYSTLAYQGYGRGIDLKILNSFCEFINKGTTPDTVILLDIDPKEGLGRAAARASDSQNSDSWNRFEEEQLTFHNKIREGFLKLSKNSDIPWLVLDASKTPEQLLGESLGHIEKLLSS